MIKYEDLKVGDKIKIKSKEDLLQGLTPISETCGYTNSEGKMSSLIEDMLIFCDTILTIKELRLFFYSLPVILVEGERYVFEAWMIDSVINPEIKEEI